jgi:integrase
LRSNCRSTATIMARINLNGKRMSIGSTGVRISPEMWSGTKGRAQGNNRNAVSVNRELDRIDNDLRSIYYRLERMSAVSLGEIKAVYLECHGDISTVRGLFSRFNEFKLQLPDDVTGKTTREKYLLAERRFLEMVRRRYRKEDMRLCDVTPAAIEEFFNHLRARVGQGNNTACKTLKTLKSIFIFGRKIGVLARDPFTGVRHTLKPVKRVHLTAEELRRLMDKNTGIERLNRIRDMFVFACFTGLSYCDIERLRPIDFVKTDGWIILQTTRRKTSQPVCVPLLDVPREILDRYMRKNSQEDTVFPALSNQKCNAYLKELADICGIKKRISFHAAHHTFATLALENGVSLESISKMLGHSSIRPTQIYAETTGVKIYREMEGLAEKLKNLDL